MLFLTDIRYRPSIKYERNAIFTLNIKFTLKNKLRMLFLFNINYHQLKIFQSFNILK